MDAESVYKVAKEVQSEVRPEVNTPINTERGAGMIMYEGRRRRRRRRRMNLLILAVPSYRWTRWAR